MTTDYIYNVHPDFIVSSSIVFMENSIGPQSNKRK